MPGRVERIELTCTFCSNLFYRTAARIRSGGGKYCSRKCKDTHRHFLVGKDSFRWNSREKKCRICDGIFFVKKSYFDQAKCCSNECRHIYYSEIFSGENNFFYIDGRSFDKYPEEFNKTLKERIKAIFNYRCGFCGVFEKDLDQRLHIHHIDHNTFNNDDNNLIPLCSSCHRSLHNERYRISKELNASKN